MVYTHEVTGSIPVVRTTLHSWFTNRQIETGLERTEPALAMGIPYGVRSLIGRVPECESGWCESESRRSPQGDFHLFVYNVQREYATMAKKT